MHKPVDPMIRKITGVARSPFSYRQNGSFKISAFYNQSSGFPGGHQSHQMDWYKRDRGHLNHAQNLIDITLYYTL